MPVLISGVLKDGTGTPVQNCTIQLKACRTSTTVVVNTVASENPDDAGRYSMDVEQGQYTVTLLVDGYPPSHAGVITVYDDSKPGTLNDFLGAMTEDDVRPEALRRFEAMVEEVARQASEASRNATAAGQASEQAQTSAGQASESATAAVNAAGAAEASATQAASSAASAESSAGTATTKAGEASASAASADTARTAAAASAAAAKTSETNAATSASTAAASATAASSSASEASTHAAASDTSASLAAQSSTAAGAAATRAEDAAKRAEDIADVISLEDASLTKKGIVKLSSATDSDSEALAATPKAVHAVMDEVQTKAPLDSPVFTGTPTTPTPPDDAKGLQTANAEFVRKLIAALVGSVPESLDTLQELADALGNDPNFATTVLNKLAGKQPLDDTLTALSGKSIEGLIEYVGLRETINHAADALQKSQNGGDIPDKKQFARTISAVTSTTITLGESGWFKIATVFMPQATSTAVIKLYGGSGYNVGSFEQAAISELVLRAGNGSPVGITATLWMRSPSSANEVAWVNTSGDTYDIYINIGQYAYWLIAQYDYTGNANVTLYSAPEYSETKPANATNGQTYTLYNSMMKPTAGDVEALSVNGGRLNGALGIGTDNVLGGSSIVFGDNDTGFKQNGDGILDTFANSQHTVRVAPGEMQVLGAIRAGNAKRMTMTSSNNSVLNAQFNLWGDGNRPTVIELDDDQGWHLYSQRNTDGSIQFVVNGQVIPDNYGNFDARYLTSGNVYTKGESDNRYVQNIQRGAPVWPGKVDEYGPAEAPAGCFLTQARHDPTTAYGVTFAYRPLQMWVGNGWRTING
ncbi:TPA: prophage tail fiber N-terminal domain-containing protein [Salmonella enterica subsp. enterica serovar Birkenhead]|uniref:prophage tail fiber N-terminal domain-containing protein n=2 Tax=Salmonella enterica TaxID=28901 RepID=UPI000A382EB7|nr:prophage tail fiber N-terminal domain-containing protein [Salmonella enterica]EBV1219182.1 shikimate transporter [Salmonella enterica subsp. enterica serovar Neunkirchen]HCB5240705.1 prophage tail fiber N-terminal domain-containing protein [Salmonella enterica subsp. enterica serovar Bron]EBJ4217089.1 shikimate transporter [Salmonella enterica]EBN9758161.1 shikimate transporter [Salmonella enterica]EBY7192844.1 shikimate transporter [Salmonella enterica subsp. enterica serovar Birkenhead]